MVTRIATAANVRSRLPIGLEIGPQTGRLRTITLGRERSSLPLRTRCRGAGNAELYWHLLANRLEDVQNALLNCTPANNARTLIRLRVLNARNRYRNAYLAKTSSIHARSIR